MPLHNGARVEGADMFDDFSDTANREGGGVFGGSLGLAEFEGVKQRTEAQGLMVEISCRKCGARANMTIEWEELYVIGSNGHDVKPLLPRGWQYSPNNAACYPGQCRCGCGANICPMVTPDEAREQVMIAAQLGYITRNQSQLWRAQTSAARGLQPE